MVLKEEKICYITLLQFVFRLNQSSELRLKVRIYTEERPTFLKKA